MHPRDTEFLRIEPSVHRFCPYCGQEIIKHQEWNGQERVDIYECTCEESHIARDIQQQIHQLQMRMPVKKYHIAPSIVKW